ncbi:unnamed protein product [Rotaria sordida]|uniref:Phosphatidate phosphatase APP1 catalytic domain-containing protein n=1 Tax=Rotaria sordida TaxID=392033 RepID=A0A813ZN67_9BILA|nr:unnamed protein product [Rotaria sordida]
MFSGLSLPIAITRNANTGILYVTDSVANSVVQIDPVANTTTTVAGGNGAGNATNQLDFPNGIYFDSATNSLVIANTDVHNIVRWFIGNNTAIVLAGTAGISGNTSTLLDTPFGVTFDSMGNMYVADTGNNRIQFFRAGQTVGTTIAGTGTAGTGASSLNTPSAVRLDNQGMSQAYRSWESSDQCSIHYVSAMPSQLYYATQTFLNKENFPGGSFHMRHLKLADSDKLNLINSIIDFVKHDASRKHKISVIENILTYASIKQKFVMVGDSGELDPEIYGEIARKYPDRIKMIFIRIVPGGKNNNSRFEIAFRNVRQDKWKTFSDATELPKKLYNDTNSINESGGGDGNIHSVYSNNTNILSTSLFYIIISVLLTLIYF